MSSDAAVSQGEMGTVMGRNMLRELRLTKFIMS